MVGDFVYWDGDLTVETDCSKCRATLGLSPLPKPERQRLRRHRQN